MRSGVTYPGIECKSQGLDLCSKANSRVRTKAIYPSDSSLLQ